MSIAHHVVGSGPRTVLLTHGWFGSADGWGPFVDDLDRDAARWVFTDVRGFGDRRGEQGDQSLDESARDLLAVADELGADRFTLVGHSMGGAVVQRVLSARAGAGRGDRRHVAGGRHADPLRRGRARPLLGRRREPRQPLRHHRLHDGQPQHAPLCQPIVDWSLAHSDVDAFARVLDAWAGADFADEVRGSELPVLVAVGEHDPALGVETVTQTWLPLYPNARLEVVANAGHYPMFEAPVHLATLINGFVADLPQD